MFLLFLLLLDVEDVVLLDVEDVVFCGHISNLEK